MGIHLRVLSESFLMNTNMTGFQKSFRPCTLEGSSPSIGRVKGARLTYLQSTIGIKAGLACLCVLFLTSSPSLSFRLLVLILELEIRHIIPKNNNLLGYIHTFLFPLPIHLFLFSFDTCAGNYAYNS